MLELGIVRRRYHETAGRTPVCTRQGALCQPCHPVADDGQPHMRHQHNKCAEPHSIAARVRGRLDRCYPGYLASTCLLRRVDLRQAGGLEGQQWSWSGRQLCNPPQSNRLHTPKRQLDPARGMFAEILRTLADLLLVSARLLSGHSPPKTLGRASCIQLGRSLG
jgi:hypothetical protein